MIWFGVMSCGLSYGIMGVKGKMWHIIKTMYNSSRGAVLLEGEKSTTFSVEQGVAQGCSLSSILFSVFIDEVLDEIDTAQIGIQLNSGNKVGGIQLHMIL